MRTSIKDEMGVAGRVHLTRGKLFEGSGIEKKTILKQILPT
jgi:hypothetical protein